jgi:hypothetical protein
VGVRPSDTDTIFSQHQHVSVDLISTSVKASSTGEAESASSSDQIEDQYYRLNNSHSEGVNSGCPEKPHPGGVFTTQHRRIQAGTQCYLLKCKSGYGTWPLRMQPKWWSDGQELWRCCSDNSLVQTQSQVKAQADHQGKDQQIVRNTTESKGTVTQRDMCMPCLLAVPTESPVLRLGFFHI